MICYHEFLVHHREFDSARRHVLRFFRTYKILSASQVSVLEKRSLRADEQAFRPRIQDAIEENRKVLAEFLTELRNTGVERLDDLAHMDQGYRTKLLHTITHILDGFFGVDSYFFNLIDDSHWICPGLYERIQASPQEFWLVGAEATYLQESRGFEKAALLGG
ncbi:MAG: hypothetical protein K6360_07070 [Deltaproteobacteria bacterium]